MTFALKIWNADGKLQLDSNSRIARIITSFNISINSGQTNFYPITGMVDDGTWFVTCANQFLQINILTGSFSVKNNIILNVPSTQVIVFRL